MKKIGFLIFALLLTISISAQEKKTFEGAMAFAELTEQETIKVTEMKKERVAKTNAIKKQKMDKATEKTKIQEIRNKYKEDVKAFLGKEKFKKMNNYWKKG
ncbi:hypothetical protein Q4Q34_14215 [Flavivirga abyssicola]|uniref:hypothetical protein n=1 Tax=Flavivirga abyssicola TaxID=3063533 RepID=UPI0026DF386C|nr:hypothetical protein [Flavivirga sp. MEBiC07777]WVK12377.1 hypothetical protein Q4Q34_14215 [Flavivirga sp. MEBiC07777]